MCKLPVGDGAILTTTDFLFFGKKLKEKSEKKKSLTFDF
jgi:hypothetical protein